ncbi:MAG: tetratricopeptide repeat protein [Microcoleus sp.]
MSTKIHQETAETNFQTGQQLAGEGKLDEAIAIYRQAIELNPNNPEFHRSLGEVLQRVGKHQEAIASYRQAIELQPKFSKAYHNLGNALSQLKQWPEAIASYRQAIELNPNFPTAYYRLAEALKQLGETESAIAAYRQAIELNPNNPDCHHSLGELWRQQGKYEDAIACYRRAIELQPKFFKAYNQLGNVLGQLKQWEEAIASYRLAIELNPNTPELHFSLGELWQQQGKHEEAIVAYRQATELQPKFSKAYHNLGNALSQLKQFEEAIACYRLAIELNPKFPSAYHRLGEALQQQGQIEDAINSYRRAIEFDPNFITSYHRLGEALQQQGQIEEAITTYRQSIDLKPNYSANIYYNLGEMLSQKQQWKEAVTYYSQSFELDPNFSPAYYKLRIALAQSGQLESDQFYQPSIDLNLDDRFIKILFILPVKGGGGGSHSVVQECLELHRCGIPVKIAVNQQNYSHFLENYAGISPINEIVASYQTITDLKRLAENFSVVCATTYSSVKILNFLTIENSRFLPAYYIQDYEPLFCRKDTPEWEEARQSYTLIPHAVLFAKTQWLCDIVNRNHSVTVHKVEPSIDHQVYYPNLGNKRDRIEISMMVRLATPIRAPRRTLAVTKILSELFPNEVHFTIFGSECNMIESSGIPIPENTTIFPHLTREEVATLLRNSDIFLDLSDYQAFGRTALEAMASGCIPFVPERGGTNEFAVHSFNSLVGDTTSIDQCISMIYELIKVESNVLLQLKLNAIETAARYSPNRAAFSIVSVFYKKIIEGYQKTQRIGALVPLTQGGTFPGSSFIRVLLPYKYLNKHEFNFQVIDLKSVEKVENLNHLVVQRNAVSNPQDARQLVATCSNRNCKLIYEIDDLLFDIGSSNLSIQRQEEIQAMTILCQAANVVTVSTVDLARAIERFNKNVVVIPNVLDDRLWKLNRKKESATIKDRKPLRLVYMGTRTHLEDFQMIEPALMQIKKERGTQVEIDLIGICDRQSIPSWANNVVIPKGANLYPKFVDWLISEQKWHIGLAPLIDNPFNRCKSYIKFLDYAAMEIPTICSISNAYSQIIEHGVNGLLVENRVDDWYKAICSLLDNSELRAKLAQVAHQQLLTEHILKVKSINWLKTLEQVLKN